jgi:hypothetical protein
MPDLSNPTQLLAKYRRREPTNLEEMLEAQVAAIESLVLECALAFEPWAKTIASTGDVRHFNIAPADGAVISERALWQRDLPRLVRETRAQVLGVGRALFDESLAGAPAAVLDVHALDAGGNHLMAQSGIYTAPGEPLRRLMEWVVVDAATRDRSGYDSSPHEVMSALWETNSPLRRGA